MGIRMIIRASSIEDAVGLLKEHGSAAKIVNGGTDVVVAMHGGAIPDGTVLIDISGISELSYVKRVDQCVQIGAGTTMADIAANAMVASSSLVLAKAAHAVGSPQIRNRATIGGNLVTAAQCADTVPALLVLDARVFLRSADRGERSVAIREFFTAPKQTAILPDELLVAVRYPSMEARGYEGRFEKLIRRAAVAKSRLNFAVLMSRKADGTVADLRIAIGSALSVPGRFVPAEAALIDQVPTHELVDSAALACSQLVVEQTGRRWSAAYKLPVIEDVMRRILADLSGIKG